MGLSVWRETSKKLTVYRVCYTPIETLQKVPKVKIQKIPYFISQKKNENKWYHAKVLQNRFDLHGHSIGFHRQNYTTLQLCPHN